jgi:predicted site-specific integrase-resolvase
VCFGVELVEYLFAKNNVQLVVVGEGAAADAETHVVLKAVVDLVQELADDLIAVPSFFVVCHNRLCSAAH